MITKLKELFADLSLQSICLIVRTQGDGLQVTVAPKGKESKQSGDPSKQVLEPKFAPFVCSGDDSEVGDFLAGGWVDQLRVSGDLAKELADQETATKKAIEKAKKAEDDAKKREEAAKKRGSQDDSKQLKKRIEELEKELQEAKIAPSFL